ncbi:Serine/threonine protein kinase [Amycolatopsis marina]|uniref:non-specific serine/threonine protein kinase n=1 Tax=Amycolatopsis marina TaxID=490629 RepID=A0A1I1CLL0_9PSEU|nr:serine/threonine-protein kinase [Amycolatopsis marina]SFB62932.1 Serine/threonine protein kinase [Amycolatopsis marina]
MGQETEPRFTLGAAAQEDERALGGPDRDGVLAGRYELGDVLGSGGTATVYQAWDRSVERSVAVKLFHPSARRADQHRQAEELRILGALHHPDLIALYDTGVHEGRPFLVMQLVSGPTLAGRILCGPLSPDETADIGVRLSRALAYVHEQGVTHRDVKPANVLLGPAGPKLGDFGIAHTFDGTRVTSTGVVVGTAAYLAPEQVRGDHVGPAADVFALGLVLLECLTGNREYPGPLAESAVARLHRSPVIPDRLSRRFGSLLRRMTALDPELRPSADEVAERLAATHSSGSLVVSARTARIAAATGRLRGTLLPVGAPVAAVSAIALGLMFLNGPDGGTVVDEGTEASPNEATGAPLPGPPPSTAWDVTSPSRAGESSPVTGEPAADESVGSVSSDGRQQPQDPRGRETAPDPQTPAEPEPAEAEGRPGSLPGNASDEARENRGKPENPGKGNKSEED